MNLELQPWNELNCCKQNKNGTLILSSLVLLECRWYKQKPDRYRTSLPWPRDDLKQDRCAWRASTCSQLIGRSSGCMTLSSVIFQTKRRRTRTFPAVSLAARWGTLTVWALVSSLLGSPTDQTFTESHSFVLLPNQNASSLTRHFSQTTNAPFCMCRPAFRPGPSSRSVVRT